MGIPVAVSQTGVEFGEPRGIVSARSAKIAPITISPELVPGIIDEIPMLAALAARASGTSRFCGLSELRVKESDRLALLAQNLIAVGVKALVDGDDLIVTGHHRPLSGRVVTQGDHRIAMAFAVLGSQSGSRIVVDDPACAAVSFPGFDAALAAVVREAAG